MDDLRERVAAVERALTDGEGDLQALADGAASAERIDSLETEVDALQEDVAELEAATQALRGYVGSVRSVNESVEERADAALAAVESIEERLPEEPTSGSANGESPSAEANPGARSRDDTPPTRTGRSDGTANGTQCGACGQSVGETPAADGGRVPSRPGEDAAGAGAPSVRGRDRASPRPRRDRDSAGIAPDPAGPEVTLRRETGASRRADGDRSRQAAESAAPGILGRLREWL